jgi:ribosome-binding factor A
MCQSKGEAMSSRKNARGNAPLRPEYEPLFPEASRTRRGGTNSKLVQLCHQVEEALSCAFLGSANPILRDLYVIGVEPLRGASLLRVLVTIDGQDYDNKQIEQALSRAQGYLRSEVAYEVHRKRVPGLEFVVVPWCTVLQETRDE